VGTLVDSRELLDLLEIENLLLAASGNPLLSITTRALGLATLTVPGASIGLQRRQEIVDINHRLLEAIEAGDTATADSLARAKGELQQSESTHRKLA
jgi:DNA-binding FadR family transcriptional regulator